MTSAARRRAYEQRGLWTGTGFVDRVRQHALDRPEAIAVVDRAGRLTYREVDDASSRLARYLVESGFRPGHVASVQLPNWSQAAVVAVGVAKAGGVAHPLLPHYRGKELRYMLGVAGTRVLFTPGFYRQFDFPSLVESVRGELPSLEEHIVVGEDAPTGATTLEGVLERRSDRQGALSPVARGLPADSVTLLIFTSGTEADPKAIMHTDQTFDFSARVAYQALGMSSEDVVWMPSPIGHSTGFNYGLRFALYHGLKLVLQDEWDPGHASELIERERCSYTLAATTFLHDLVSAPQARRRNLRTMRLFGSGGAPVPPELVEAAAELGVQVLRLYGATEFLVASWNRPDSPLEKRRRTDGCSLHESVELSVRDDEGRPRAPREDGEIWVRGPNVCVGFFNDPERTGRTFTSDGWLKSGDIGVLDPDGYLSVVGRKKEIIIRGGLNIAPREIEDLLVRMPGVSAAAVVGLPDARLGETSCACVKLEPGERVTLEETVAFLEGQGLAKYKLPERLFVIDSLPMTPSGKVRKHELVRQLLPQPATER